MLMSLHIDFHDNLKMLCLDEVVGVIESPKEKVEAFYPLALKFSEGFLNCNIGGHSQSMHVLIGCDNKVKVNKMYFDDFWGKRNHLCSSTSAC